MAFGLLLALRGFGLSMFTIAHTVIPCSKITKTVIQAVIGRVKGFGIMIVNRIRIKNKPVYGFVQWFDK